jgi:hypothetical protein
VIASEHGPLLKSFKNLRIRSVDSSDWYVSSMWVSWIASSLAPYPVSLLKTSSA